jgi:hypothetical protein
MRNSNDRHPLRRLLQAILQQLLRLRIQRTCRVIKEQELEFPDQSTRNSQTLFLASRQMVAVRTAVGVVAARHFDDCVVDIGQLARFFEISLGWALVWSSAESQIETNDAVEDDALLRDVGDVVAEGCVAVGYIAAIDIDGSGVWSVEVLYQRDDISILLRPLTR